MTIHSITNLFVYLFLKMSNLKCYSVFGGGIELWTLNLSFVINNRIDVNFTSKNSRKGELDKIMVIIIIRLWRYYYYYLQWHCHHYFGISTYICMFYLYVYVTYACVCVCACTYVYEFSDVSVSATDYRTGILIKSRIDRNRTILYFNVVR